MLTTKKIIGDVYFLNQGIQTAWLQVLRNSCPIAHCMPNLFTYIPYKRDFKSFLKVERDAPALVVLDSSFHQRGITNEKSLVCRTCTDGSAKQRSLDERSILGETFARTRAFKYVGDR